jgi:hypothetical protein
VAASGVLDDAVYVTSLPDLAALEAAVLQALVDKDRPTLMALLDERFVITTAGWLAEPAGRDEWVQEVLDRHLMHDFSIHSIEERALDGVLVALVLSSQSVTWQGQRQTYRFRYTDVWRPEGEQWLLAVRHASMLPVIDAT